MAGIETEVTALETTLHKVKAYLKREAEALPQMHVVLEACAQQQQYMVHIAGHLPAYLPSIASPPEAQDAGHPLGATPPIHVLQERQHNPRQPTTLAAAKSQKRGGAGPAAGAPPASAPRRFVSQEELDSLSSYMRGRTTLDKVNAALEELAQRAEATAALVTAARRHRTAGADKKHAEWLLYNFAVRVHS